jgi:hypothetical protein
VSYKTATSVSWDARKISNFCFVCSIFVCNSEDSKGNWRHQNLHFTIFSLFIYLSIITFYLAGIPSLYPKMATAGEIIAGQLQPSITTLLFIYHPPVDDHAYRLDLFVHLPFPL